MGSAAISPLGRADPDLCQRVWVLVALVIALWLATRPYLGIVGGDGRLYAVQALNALQNGRFADDMYFQFGSQDQFTLFSRLYAPFLALLGVGRGALVVTVLTQAAWVAGLVFLIHTLTRDLRQALLAAALVIALPSQYGPLGFGELFVSPRLFAEALSMLALAMLLRGRNVSSLAILLASASVHPLATVPALAVWFCYQFRPRPAWLGAAIVLLAVPVVLCVAGVAPFNWLGQTFDPAWAYALSSCAIRSASCWNGDRSTTSWRSPRSSSRSACSDRPAVGNGISSARCSWSGSAGWWFRCWAAISHTMFSWWPRRCGGRCGCWR